MQAHWILSQPSDDAAVSAFARELGCGLSMARLLIHRGFAEAGPANDFLNPRLKTLSDPFLLPDMRAAVERVMLAIDRREKIVLYGDYDVDGVTSLALLTRMLRAYGAKVECFLPLRADEGYGLTAEGLARCSETYRMQLLIAVDCGTSSAFEVSGLTERGVDVIILDHHECKTVLPRCIGVVNPKRSDIAPSVAAHDYRYLCSVGLVFKLCHALLKTRAVLPESSFVLREALDLVALGTVADIVPLVRENRIFVQKGLEQMAETRWPGLRALMEVAGVTLPLSPVDIGFQLGPRLNASGRLGTAQDSLELLLTEDENRAGVLAKELDMQNRERQRVEKQTVTEADKQIEFDPERDAAIVVGADGWHPGVLGIVASRICKRYHRPAFVIGFDENGVGKGSGRSIDALSLVAALDRCGHLLERFGGHEMAAGLTMKADQFSEFRRVFCESARAMLTDDELRPRMKLDAEVMLSEVDFKFLSLHEKFQPFGMGNAQPLFIARGVRLLEEPKVMKEKHLRLLLGQNGARQQAVFFNGALEKLPHQPWDIAFRVERNEWREQVTVQIQIQRIRTAEASTTP